MKTMMQGNIINGSGWSMTILAIWLDVAKWITEIEFNQVMTVTISLLSVLFLTMKIYDQYLITKRRRKEGE